MSEYKTKELAREAAKRYRLRHPNRCKEATQRWRERNPDKVKEQTKRYKKDNRHLISHRKWRYGITQEQFNSMIENQNNKCAICSIDFKEKPHIDHDHTTKKIRAILCFHCNAGLGMFKDNEILLIKASEYLKLWGMK